MPGGSLTADNLLPDTTAREGVHIGRRRAESGVHMVTNELFYRTNGVEVRKGVEGEFSDHIIGSDDGT
jgi:hypothetical protein